MTGGTTERTHELIGRLVSRLDELDEPARRSWLSHLLTTLEDGSPDEPSAAPDTPLEISDWATNLGEDGARQSLAVDRTPGPVRVKKTRAATGRSLLSNGRLGADLVHVPAGEGFAPHTHPGDHLLSVVGGQGTITVDGVITSTAPGQAYLIEGAVPHAVGAITDHVILAVGSPHRRLDSDDRQELVAYTALSAPLRSIHCSICGLSAPDGEALAGSGCPHSPHQYG